jgi:hypothetical protein
MPFSLPYLSANDRVLLSGVAADDEDTLALFSDVPDRVGDG